MEAAFWSAERVTLAGSTIPAFHRSTNSPVAALKPRGALLSRLSAMTTDPSRPVFSAIQ